MTIVLLGPSGEGSETHAENFKTRFNKFQVGVGDVFRLNLETRTASGLDGQPRLCRGEKVRDDLFCFCDKAERLLVEIHGSINAIDVAKAVKATAQRIGAVASERMTPGAMEMVFHAPLYF